MFLFERIYRQRQMLKMKLLQIFSRFLPTQPLTSDKLLQPGELHLQSRKCLLRDGLQKERLLLPHLDVRHQSTALAINAAPALPLNLSPAHALPLLQNIRGREKERGKENQMVICPSNYFS